MHKGVQEVSVQVIDQEGKQIKKKNTTSTNPYEDIINLPRHRSLTHPPMSVYDRAAQFSPFAALTGYDGEIKEAARLTNDRIELDDTQKVVLDEKLQIVNNHIQDRSELVFTYFQPDSKKDGGSYQSIRGIVKKIDLYERIVALEEGTIVPIEDIIEITGNMFGDLYFV